MGAADSNTEMAAVRFEEPPTIDGQLDDPVWASAARAEGFVQIRPMRGEPSPFLTTVFLGYDDEALYVAIRAQDEEIGRIAAAPQRGPPVLAIVQGHSGLFKGFHLDLHRHRRIGTGFP